MLIRPHQLSAQTVILAAQHWRELTHCWCATCTGSGTALAFACLLPSHSQVVVRLFCVRLARQVR
jgi:hypothetical protein